MADKHSRSLGTRLLNAATVIGAAGLMTIYAFGMTNGQNHTSVIQKATDDAAREVTRSKFQKATSCGFFPSSPWLRQPDEYLDKHVGISGTALMNDEGTICVTVERIPGRGDHLNFMGRVTIDMPDRNSANGRAITGDARWFHVTSGSKAKTAALN